MSFTIEKLPGKPIILVHFNEDYDASTEMEGFFKARNALLDQQTEPVYTIIDTRSAKFDVMAIELGANFSRLGGAEHANALESVLVADSQFLKLAMKGMDSDMYRHKKIPVFDDLQKALDYISSK